MQTTPHFSLICQSGEDIIIQKCRASGFSSHEQPLEQFLRPDMLIRSISLLHTLQLLHNFSTEFLARNDLPDEYRSTSDQSMSFNKIKYIILVFDFCRFCVVIHFSSLPQRPMTSDFEGFSIADFIHHIYFPILILEKEPVFPFLMFSAK